MAHGGDPQDRLASLLTFDFRVAVIVSLFNLIQAIASQKRKN